jgi:hypothetical protein
MRLMMFAGVGFGVLLAMVGCADTYDYPAAQPYAARYPAYPPPAAAYAPGYAPGTYARPYPAPPPSGGSITLTLPTGDAGY